MSTQKNEGISNNLQPTTSGPFSVVRNGDFADVVSTDGEMTVEAVDWSEARTIAECCNRAHRYALTGLGKKIDAECSEAAIGAQSPEDCVIAVQAIAREAIARAAPASDPPTSGSPTGGAA